jgi:hypothetical protein
MTVVRFGGPIAPFPRAGAWCTVDGRLGVIFELVKVRQPDKTLAVEAAEVHFVADNGETIEVAKDVPIDQLAIAALDDFAHLERAAHLTPFQAARTGYRLSEEQVASLSALEKRQLNLPMTDAELAQALIEESDVQAAVLREQAIAAHPDALALEAEIEAERAAFVASVEGRRSALAARLQPRRAQS